MDLAALRIDAVEDRLDGAVLAGRIHALEDQEQRPAVLRVEFFLKIAQVLAVGIEDLFGLVLVETALLVGLDRLQMKRARSVEAERRDEAVELGCKRFRGLLAHDGNPCWWLRATPLIATLTLRLYGLLRCSRNDGDGWESSSCSMNAVTKRGIAAVRSDLARTRWIAESSGSDCRARLASIRFRIASPEMPACKILIMAIEAAVTTQSQWAPA